MIDWVTAIVKLKHPVIRAGGYFNFDENGEHIKTVVKPRTIVGSWSSSVQAKTQDLTECRQFGSELFIDGNPSKFLQGHNVVGSDNLCDLVLGTIQEIAKANDFEVSDFDKKRILSGDFELKRLDINYPFELPTQSDVNAWISAASNQSKTRHGLPHRVGTSIYWGYRSSVWLMKAYNKFAEVNSGKKNHRLPNELLNSPLLPWVENKLRIELQLRKELKKIVQHRFNTDKALAKFFTPSFCKEIFFDYLGRIEMNRNLTVNTEQSMKLSNAARGSYFLWRQGLQVIDCVSRASYYRHRKEIMSIMGVDISLPRDLSSEEHCNVVPLIRELVAQSAEIPSHLSSYIFQLGA